IHPDHAYILLVGKGSEIAPKLERFGEVKYYDIYGNPYTPSTQASLPADLTVEKVIQDYIQALGGLEKINAVNSYKVSSKASVPGAELVINNYWKKPNKISVEISANGNLFQTVKSDGKEVSIEMMGQKSPVDDATREQTLFESYIVPELVYEKAGVTLKLQGVEKVEDKDAYAIEYTYPSGSTATSYFDTESGLKIKSVRVVKTPQGEVTQSTRYADYEEKGGVKFPQTVTQDVGPQTLKMEVTSMEVNVPVEEEVFQIN
ncbi:MAG TPA: hypothetical protein VKZ75_02215, partial [Cyclobacteriaceae bacterium]|nr:hypothetical protein [Cyclobacteriaceae bacterium]